VQVDPINATLNAPGLSVLKLKYVKPLSSCSFKFKLRRYTVGELQHQQQQHSAPVHQQQPQQLGSASKSAKRKPTPGAGGREADKWSDGLWGAIANAEVGRCRLTLSNPR
jgi:hypothetical protein